MSPSPTSFASLLLSPFLANEFSLSANRRPTRAEYHEQISTDERQHSSARARGSAETTATTATAGHTCFLVIIIVVARQRHTSPPAEKRRRESTSGVSVERNDSRQSRIFSGASAPSCAYAGAAPILFPGRNRKDAIDTSVLTRLSRAHRWRARGLPAGRAASRRRARGMFLPRVARESKRYGDREENDPLLYLRHRVPHIRRSTARHSASDGPDSRSCITVSRTNHRDDHRPNTDDRRTRYILLTVKAWAPFYCERTARHGSTMTPDDDGDDGRQERREH